MCKVICENAWALDDEFERIRDKSDYMAFRDEQGGGRHGFVRIGQEHIGYTDDVRIKYNGSGGRQYSWGNYYIDSDKCDIEWDHGKITKLVTGQQRRDKEKREEEERQKEENKNSSYYSSGSSNRRVYNDDDEKNIDDQDIESYYYDYMDDFEDMDDAWDDLEDNEDEWD